MTANTDRAGRSAKSAFSSPSSGGHLSAGDGAHISIPARLVLDACERYEAAAWFASPADKAIAASELVAELRALTQPKTNDQLRAALARWVVVCPCDCDACHNLELVFLSGTQSLPDFGSQAEYDFYTTLMEQAEERKS